MKHKRIIPCLDLYQGRVVKGVHFTGLRDAGDPVEIAEYYSQVGADELVLLDINATYEKRNIMIDVVRKIAEQTNIPLTVGGGIRTIEDVREILNAGAQKISLNSAAVQTPELINELVLNFESRRVVVAVDVKKRENYSGWDVYINGGRMNTNIDVLKWVQEVEKRGAGEILLTSMDRDGTKSGYDISLLKCVKEKVTIPIIASGGAGTMKDFYDAFEKGHADAALAASLFHFKEIDIQALKKFLYEKKVPVF